MDRKDLLPLLSVAAVILASALTAPAAFAQNQTEAAESCPREYSMVDGVCTVDEVKRDKFATILLKQYNAHLESTGSEAFGAPGSSGSAEQLVIVIFFEADDCSLPEDLGIVLKGQCDTSYGRAQMAVLLPVANLYDVAALDQVTGIYPDGEADPGGMSEPAPSADDEPTMAVLDIAESSSTATHDNPPYYIVLVGFAAAAAAIATIRYTKQRRRIEA